MTNHDKNARATGAVPESELVELADSSVAGGTTPWVTATIAITTVTLTAAACPTSACTKSC
jgi:hypothetical protein